MLQYEPYEKKIHWYN